MQDIKEWIYKIIALWSLSISKELWLGQMQVFKIFKI